MERFQTLSTHDIRIKRNKISILSPLKIKESNSKPNYIVNIKSLNNHLSLLNIYNKKNSKYPKTLTIEEYDNLQNNSLSKYISKDLKGENIDEKEEIHTENNVPNKKSNNDRLLTENNSEPKIHIRTPKKSYDNPQQSLRVINSNNNIFNSISKGSLIRQRILYDNWVKNFENYANKFKTKMPKIKTSRMDSKISDEIPMINLVENNKKLEEVLPPIPSNGNLRLFSYFKYPEKNFPEGREQFSICTKGRNILLSGGVSTNMKEMNFWSLNIKSLEWKKINSMNQANGRFGHTTIYNDNKIYIYGGRIKEKNKSILVGLEIFSLKDYTFSKPYIQKEPPDRRNHIALYICNHMLIHGGVDVNNEVLSDCHFLNLETLKWVEPHIEQYTQKPKVYGHSYSLVIPFKLLTHKSFSIYKFPEFANSSISINKIKIKGLYIFGGKTEENGGLSNDLWILMMGQKPLTWMKPNIKGKPPSPRLFHTMDYYEKANYLIVHGGRNDELSETSALDDTFVLDLDNLEWVKVELYSNTIDFKVISRYGHKSTIFSNKLIIFGGINNNNYIGSSLFIVNLDFYYSLNKKTIEQMNIERIKNDDKLGKDKKLKKMKIELGRLKLGVVLPINLPPIK